MSDTQAKAPSHAQLLRAARKAFGFEEFRPGQEEAIASVLGGRDTLAVMPTGSGKSAIYELAGARLRGATVVVSPLIALQRDQVETINGLDLGSAALVNSTLKAAERREAFAGLEAGELEFLFLAPEQLANDDVRARIVAAKPSLFVVDEAHCVSEWGHDFRPDYLRLGDIIEELGHPTVLALTATAAPPVRAEIVARLRMRDANVIVEGFDRPNIRLGVRRFEREEDKRIALVGRVKAAAKPGVVYTATQSRSEEIAALLSAAGVRAEAYHGGMKAAERERVQDAFMRDEMETIVATTAFGMGIDKPNVRFVFHHDVSDSLDAYYQEVGRAGRDGEPADALLFYRPEDIGLRRFFAASGGVDTDQIAQVAYAIERHDGPVDLADLRDETGFSQSKIVAAISRLEDTGALATLPTGEIVEDRPISAQDIVAAVEAGENHQRFERSRVEMMRSYAETAACRRAVLLSYFGEATAVRCENCDRCEATRDDPDALPAPVPDNTPFGIGDRVAHKQWGAGAVMRYEDNAIVVLFDRVGYKSLALELVLQNGLLAAAH